MLFYGVFIKEVYKKNKGYDKTFYYHRLMESYRTSRGPRHRKILNLGKLDIPRNQWKILTNRIEAILSGQSSYISVDEHIESLASHYASLIIQKSLAAAVEAEVPDYETVDINSLSNSRSRTIGAEYVGLAMFRELGLNALFNSLGFTQDQINLAVLSVVGRLVSPASEKGTREWAQYLSGLDELLGTDFSRLSNNAIYRISDSLLSYKEEIERHLKVTECNLFSLREKIILYDLTNTYFEGENKGNKKAKRGRSKDKRNDCPLITLGLVIDEMGFPKGSKIFKGNVSESKTLIEMLEALQGEKIREGGKEVSEKQRKGITVVLDAGIATEKNLTLLKGEGYDYVCVARNKPMEISKINRDDLINIKKDRDRKIEVKLIKESGESILYCKSFLRAKKEEAIKNQFQDRFEEGLKGIEASLSKRGCIKKYEKVLERIGRLKERYFSIAHYYKIEVKQKDGIAIAIAWRFEKQKEAEDRFSGSYFLRTSRTDLTEEEIWSLYIMLTNVEDAFRSLKDELNLRPIHHQKEKRVDGHLFITVLAYHLLNSIRTKLHKHGIYMRWSRVRKFLSSHVRITTSMTAEDGRRIHVRNSSEPEWFHKTIYNALGLSPYPLPAKRINVKIRSAHKKLKT